MRAATAALHVVLGDALLGVYLHGSAVLGGLRPQSDIDLLVIVDRPMTNDQRKDLLSAFLQISATHPSTPGGRRCVEVIVFVASELAGQDYPAQAEFTYGEWLRDAFEAGEMPIAARDPENSLVLAQALREVRPLFGPNASDLLPEIPLEHVRCAMHDALPALLGGLQGDERNVLLTLARMWRTAKTGEFVSKDAGAAWAVAQMPDQEAYTLDFAHKAYLGDVRDDWSNRRDAAQRAAEYLRRRISELL